jgi:cytochrome P450
MTLCGHYIPAGCTAASVPWIVARSQEIYGTDADRFRPERWLEVDDETRKQWNKWDFTFGFGARRCLGRGFAEIILWRVAMLFLARFQVKRVEGENREAVDFTPRAGQRIGEQRFEIVAKSGAAERSASGS